MGEKYPFLAYLGHLPTWTRAIEVGAVAFFALVGFREAERWFNPACPPATWQGALVFGVAAALLDLLDRSLPLDPLDRSLPLLLPDRSFLSGLLAP